MGNEYFTGSAELAVQLGCTQQAVNNIVEYALPPAGGNSWLLEAHPAAGLFVANAYFILPAPVVREYAVRHRGVWLCALSSGVVSILESGKKARPLQNGIHLVQTGKKPFKIVYGEGKRISFTGIWLFDDFVQARPPEPSYFLPDYGDWQFAQYNTPDILLLFEQLKYALRIAGVPLSYYESKAGELLALIQRNSRDDWFCERHLRQQRRRHVTYQNKRYMFQVKAEIDKNIMAPPPVSRLAVIAGMGATKLRQCFKETFGLTMDAYMRRERMMAAMRLLSNDDLNIKNIAAAVGYKNTSQFIASFKKVHGFTPNAFRKLFGL
ncbi:helix-turn-helix domain-containing protein [Sporomusa termitida]|uniref:HTH-type transcriptional activator RhaR n=1 Tax=Sporomusa termitida TaxID=2377 RepID=A0A517DQ70_9FIRM|nr:AraC family transcriptional regulator [Sporomusa termitida]QDR79513.1 HTH-type transcriptional activator RhaR [Sporomusa termitida]